jgi:hypothetical protein
MSTSQVMCQRAPLRRISLTQAWLRAASPTSSGLHHCQRSRAMSVP